MLKSRNTSDEDEERAEYLVSHMYNRRSSLGGVLILICIVLAGCVAAAQRGLPELVGSVNDFADVIDKASADAMDKEIRDLMRRTGDVIVVATVQSCRGFENIRECSTQLFNRTGIGQRGKNNGILVLVAVEDKEARITTGSGMEGTITDEVAREIVYGEMIPKLRIGAYGAGMRAGVSALVSRVRAARGLADKH